MPRPQTRSGRAILIALALSPLLASANETPVPATNPATPEGPETAPNTPGTPPEKIPATTVTGRADSLVGRATTASQGVVGRDHLELRPLLQPGELLETVPGLVITQHSGSGKANQYYLRGFNLDHGTDFATFVDGMPVNMPSHGHGQGYSDLNFVIPELVQRIDYRKGPYFAENGDFASAGSADLRLGLPSGTGFATAEIGSWNYFRQVVAKDFEIGEKHLLVGFEHLNSDGPWDSPEGYEKFNGLMRYSGGDEAQGWSVTGMAYHGDWNATDQVPRRALDSGLIGRYGSLNTSDGGDSQRYSLQAESHWKDSDSESRLTAYAFYYDMSLASDFTYFMDDPVNGDQFTQKDARWVGGLSGSHLWREKVCGLRTENLVGFQTRSDHIDNGLSKTNRRVFVSQVRRDDIAETSGALYFQNTTHWTEWFRTVAGVRGDLFHFDVDSDNPANNGSEVAAIASPKVGIVLGPWAKTEFYANAGLGYHSNDARGVTTTFDPGSASAVNPADPLVRTRGAEVGVRTSALRGLQSSVALWALESDSELLFVGDAGTNEPSRPTRRIGVEFDNSYTLNKHLTFESDISLSRARFTDSDPAGARVPGAIESAITGGIFLRDFHGFFGGVQARYFGARPLVEDNSVRSTPAFTVNLSAGYRFNEHWEIKGQVFNVFNRRNQDVAYYYESQLPGEAGPVADIHQHPAEPTSFRLAITGRF